MAGAQAIRNLGLANPPAEQGTLSSATDSCQGPQVTPSFFCNEEEDVVYWKSSFLPG